MGGEPVAVWHGDTDLHGADAAILPGGFSYGDYLRTGAIARFAPAMRAVRDLAEAGGPVLGICNGFQILCEAGLLPGALIRNRRAVVRLPLDQRAGGGRGRARARSAARGDVLPIPIKHGEGQFVASAEELDRLEREGQVALRYCSPTGEVSDAYNPNGAARNIAGVWNAGRNVLGTHAAPRARRRSRPGADGRAGDPRLAAVGGPRSRAGMTEPLHRALGPDRRRVRGDRQAAGARAEPRRAGHVLGDVERALLVQVEQGAPAHAPHRGTAGAGRDRARTPASWTSGTASRACSRWSRTRTRRPSSRTRAPRPASAGSCATCCRWARGRRRCSTRCGSGRWTTRGTGSCSAASWPGSAATATASACRRSAARCGSPSATARTRR